MTREMRELEEDKKAMRYETVAIRVKFKNQLVLQGLFRPKEKSLLTLFTLKSLIQFYSLKLKSLLYMNL
jgi:hypothetical protein